MQERTMRRAVIGVGWVVMGWLVVAAVARALDLPAGPMADLGAEEFRKRESAQAALLAWAREHPEGAADELLRQSKEAADPEVRERCMAVLKELVNDEYLKDGEGYMGIQMLDELAKVPGDPLPRGVVRVTMVVPDSAAQQAGIQLNDLVVGIGDDLWHELGASFLFKERIRQLKPSTKVLLKVLRNGNLMDIEVKLSRRPPAADLLFFDPRQLDVEAVERAAKDAYFKRWLERKKSRK